MARRIKNRYVNEELDIVSGDKVYKGKNVDMQSAGDFSRNSLTEEEAKKYMDSYARDIVKHPEDHDYTLYE